MTRLRIRTLLNASFALLSSGCTALARISAPSLQGSPETTGIVVIEPDITFYENHLGTGYGEQLIGGAVARADDPKQVVSGPPTSGLVVFSGLSPGKWRLTLIEGQLEPWDNLPDEVTRWRRHYVVPPEQADAFSIEVRAGEVVYAAVGIVDDDRAASRGVRFSRPDEPAAEQKAWIRMDELYRSSPWGPVFRAKIGASPAADPQSPH